MEGMITGALARELSGRREEYNKRFAVMQRLYPRISPAAFSALLASHVQPLVNSADESSPGSAPILCESLYDILLEGLGKGIFSTQTGVADAWRDILAGYPGFLSAEPGRFPRAAANALHHLGSHSQTAPRAWARILLSLTGHAADAGQLFHLGKAAAWRCGMAHYREGAIGILKGLSPGVQRIILDLPENVPDKDLPGAISRMEEDPWHDPAERGTSQGKRELAVVAAAGAFRGFGGTFTSPPLVEAAGGGIVAFDQEGTWLISADIYGTTLSRINMDDEEPGGAAGEGSIDRSGRAAFLGLTGSFPGLAEPVSFACSAHTMAVTIASSHSVFLIAGRGHAR